MAGANENLTEDKTSRQQQINDMDVGDSISLSQRIDLSFGLTNGAVRETTALLRGTLDQQANRARKGTSKEYVVENGSYLTNAGALIVVCTISRIG